jgi:hypothetical protein
MQTSIANDFITSLRREGYSRAEFSGSYRISVKKFTFEFQIKLYFYLGRALQCIATKINLNGVEIQRETIRAVSLEAEQECFLRGLGNPNANLTNKWSRHPLSPRIREL